jgi:ADP-heptose:LPS heptosyltransferase
VPDFKGFNASFMAIKVDSMRKIDRRVGVPLCFLMSIWVWLKETLTFVRKGKPDLSKTLFIELSEMGSAILVDPAMRKLKNAGDNELFFVIFESNAKSLEILNTVASDHIFRMRADNLFHLAIDVVAFFFWSRRNKIRTVIDLELFSRFTALLTALSGARARVGFASFHDEGLYRGSLINHRVRYNSHVHISVNFMSLVNTALGYHSDPYPVTPVQPEELKLEKVTVDEEKTEKIREKITGLYPAWSGERIVLINVNASDLLPQRRWPQENFSLVTKKLLEKFDDILVVATGAPAEREYVQAVVDMVGNKRCVNSAGVFRFEELVPLYSLSTLMLTNDSGPAHFAAVTPVKVFVLFGPETPSLYLPLGNAEPFYLGLPCSPCVSAANHRKTTCTARPCITGIDTGWVGNRVAEYLETGA